MSSLSSNMRTRANELDATLQNLLAQPGVNADFIRAVKAAVVPEMMLTLADVLDHVDAAVPDDKSMRLRRLIQRNHAIREAVANGDRNELDRILDGIIGDAGASVPGATDAKG